MDIFDDGTNDLRIVLPYPYIFRRNCSVLLKVFLFKTDRLEILSEIFWRAGNALLTCDARKNGKC